MPAKKSRHNKVKAIAFKIFNAVFLGVVVALPNVFIDC